MCYNIGCELSTIHSRVLTLKHATILRTATDLVKHVYRQYKLEHGRVLK